MEQKKINPQEEIAETMEQGNNETNKALESQASEFVDTFESPEALKNRIVEEIKKAIKESDNILEKLKNDTADYIVEWAKMVKPEDVHKFFVEDVGKVIKNSVDKTFDNFYIEMLAEFVIEKMGQKRLDIQYPLNVLYAIASSIPIGGVRLSELLKKIEKFYRSEYDRRKEEIANKLVENLSQENRKHVLFSLVYLGYKTQNLNGLALRAGLKDKLVNSDEELKKYYDKLLKNKRNGLYLEN